MAQLTKAELLYGSGRPSELAASLDGLVTLLTYYPDLHAHYERVLACALAADGDAYAARTHFDRAKRIYDSLGHVPGLLELDRRWTQATSRAVSRAASTASVPTAADPAARARTAVQAAGALLLHAGRPDLLAREIVELLAATSCVSGAAAISRDASGQETTLVVSGTSPSDAPAARRLAVGASGDHTIDVVVTPKLDVESIATLNAVTLMLATIHDLECARAEREERLTLWPIDDVPLEGVGQAVVAGQMRELMSVARRVATTNVSVLITGESGTGKEILARAIHSFSRRAQKPFVPFNCTAIPRELLESQLFGYRRGSFTGADRDSPGLIRAAREGTLFLDEVGELGLELQPKLLRFLESGEISPLGETSPLTVDVRVIAATNSNLEQSVKDGRFREDLFYRLNVIRLRIAPLRERRDEIPGLVNYFVGRAAQEFDKGQVRLAEETMEYLLLYPWPGNVRQLNNELRRMIALAERDTVLTPPHLSDVIRRDRSTAARALNGSEIAVPLHDKLGPTLSKIEHAMIKAALHEHHGKVDAAAHALGISRKGLYLKRQRLGL
jgi:DNA-binding NtrC family response regulator